MDIFSLLILTPCLWETAQYKLKYRFKGPFNKQNKKTTIPPNTLSPSFRFRIFEIGTHSLKEIFSRND